MLTVIFLFYISLHKGGPSVHERLDDNFYEQLLAKFEHKLTI